MHLDPRPGWAGFVAYRMLDCPQGRLISHARTPIEVMFRSVVQRIAEVGPKPKQT